MRTVERVPACARLGRDQALVTACASGRWLTGCDPSGTGYPGGRIWEVSREGRWPWLCLPSSASRHKAAFTPGPCWPSAARRPGPEPCAAFWCSRAAPAPCRPPAGSLPGPTGGQRSAAADCHILGGPGRRPRCAPLPAGGCRDAQPPSASRLHVRHASRPGLPPRPRPPRPEATAGAGLFPANKGQHIQFRPAASCPARPWWRSRPPGASRRRRSRACRGP